jgi:hypothetical protein
MATRYIGHLAASLVRAPNRADIVGAALGGTLAGSQDVQIVFDDTVFTSAYEGRQRLLAAILAIYNDIETGRSWPIDSTT